MNQASGIDFYRLIVFVCANDNCRVDGGAEVLDSFFDSILCKVLRCRVGEAVEQQGWAGNEKRNCLERAVKKGMISLLLACGTTGETCAYIQMLIERRQEERAVLEDIRQRFGHGEDLEDHGFPFGYHQGVSTHSLRDVFDLIPIIFSPVLSIAKIDDHGIESALEVRHAIREDGGPCEEVVTFCELVLLDTPFFFWSVRPESVLSNVGFDSFVPV